MRRQDLVAPLIPDGVMTTGTIDPASKRHLPDFTSAVAVPGLSGKVDLRRDTWGIPHVRAASHLDAFAGLGFAHAQDRLLRREKTGDEEIALAAAAIWQFEQDQRAALRQPAVAAPDGSPWAIGGRLAALRRSR